MHENSLTLSQSTRKEISKFLTNTDQSHFFLSLVKFFKKILCNSIFEYVHENCLLCDNQSGFRPSDSCEYQLFSIVYDIYASFDCNLSKDVRGIFLDITKAFDRVWHKGLICKMKCIGMTVMPLKLLQSFLQNRHQQVLLNDQCSSGAPVFCWCTPGFCIGPLFFLIYIYKWLNKEDFINQETICWYLHFFYCKWNWCFWTWVEQWSEEKISVGLSMEDVPQSRCSNIPELR